MRYIYWPNGILEIRNDEGRAVHFGGPVMGECIYGEPRPGDTVTTWEGVESVDRVVGQDEAPASTAAK